MTTLLAQASDALIRNDAVALEKLCAEAETVLTAAPHPADGRAALAHALLVFRRQVLAARGQVILRRRFSAAHTSPEGPWAR